MVLATFVTSRRLVVDAREFLCHSPERRRMSPTTASAASADGWCLSWGSAGALLRDELFEKVPSLWMSTVGQVEKQFLENSRGACAEI